MKVFRLCFSIILLWTVVFSAWAEEKVDYLVVEKIKQEGFQNSQVMELAGYMTDILGPRFSNSHGYTQAAKWAEQKFIEFGISATMQAYGEVGPGWENKYTSVHMHEPKYMPFIAYTKPYSMATSGQIVADVVPIDIEKISSLNDLRKYQGRLQGKIIFTKSKRQLYLNFKPAAVRLSKTELDDMAELHILPQARMRSKYGEFEKSISRAEIMAFFKKEGAAVLVEPGEPQGDAPMDKGLVHVSASRPLKKNDPRPLPAVIVAAEHYNRVMRILEKGIAVKMEVETRVEWEEDDLRDFNVIAEIPGSDLKHEIVMIGGHYDGEPSGTGATDNAAGCAAVMEAMRILKTIGVKPRRTIRAALWGAEEAGHLGSKAYVKQHFGDPETQKYLPDHKNLSVYFNMDWYGRFRGIFLQGNDLVRPIFAEWMKPFHELGMTHLVPGNTGGTDHMDFVDAGLPGFQFIQDDLEFFTTTFHTNMDVYDRLVPEDLMQASVILASFAYNAAMRDEKLPRTKNQMKNNRRWHK